DAPQALLEAGRERPDRDAARAFGLPDAYLQEAKRDHEWRRDQRGDERERGAEDEHPDREGQESHQVGHQDGDTRREHGVQSFDVRRAATDEVAHRRPVKAADGEPLNVREEANPQTAEHPLRDGRCEIGVEERHRLDGGAGAQIEEREQEQASRPADEQMLVDDRPHDERWSKLERSGGEHEQHDGDGSRPPGLQQARQVSDERASPGGRAVSSDDGSTHRRAPSTDIDSALSCARKIRAYRPDAATSSACVPTASIRPSCSTTTRSAYGNTARRCEHAMMVTRSWAGASMPNACLSDMTMRASVVTATAANGASG